MLCQFGLHVPPPHVQSAIYPAAWDFWAPTLCLQASMVAALLSTWSILLVNVGAPSSSASTSGSSSVERGSIYGNLMACCRRILLVEGYWTVVEWEGDLGSVARRFLGSQLHLSRVSNSVSLWFRLKLSEKHEVWILGKHSCFENTAKDVF